MVLALTSITSLNSLNSYLKRLQRDSEQHDLHNQHHCNVLRYEARVDTLYHQAAGRVDVPARRNGG